MKRQDEEYMSEGTVRLTVRIRKDQAEFFRSHPLLYRSSVARKGIDLYIDQLYDDREYRRIEKEYKKGKKDR